MNKAAETRIIALGEKYGEITPDMVVKDAKNPLSPLHCYFDWNDKKAAHKWRIEQARELIREVKVTIKTDTKEIRVARYVQNPAKPHGDQGYIATKSLEDDPAAASAVLCSEFNSAISHLRRAYRIAISLDLMDEIASIEKRILKLKDGI